MEVRGVAAEACLHCEPVPGRRAALPEQTLIGFDTASRRREEAFLLRFFPPSFISKRESFFCMKGPSSALLSALSPPGSVVLLVLLLGSVFHSSFSLCSYIDSLTFFFSQINASRPSFTFVFLFYCPLSLGC